MLGTLVAVVVESMLFMGLISAFLIAKKSLPPVMWPPPDQPRFPVEATALNTAVLIASGIACFVAVALYRRSSARAPLVQVAALVLGALFVGLQGVEWARLLSAGLTLTSSLAGSYFYLLIGMHGLHALGGLVALAVSARGMATGRISRDAARAVRVYWIFVVALWPLLYWLVYLS